MTIRQPRSCTASSANRSCCRWRSATAAVRLGGKALNIAADGAASGASKLFVRRHDMQIGPAGSGALEGAVRHVRSFGPIQRAEVALVGGEGKTVIEIDAPRDRELQDRRYRRTAAPPLPDFRRSGMRRSSFRVARSAIDVQYSGSVELRLA